MSYTDHENGNDRFFKDFSAVKKINDGDIKSVISLFDKISSGYTLHMGELNTIIQQQLVELLFEQIQLDDNLNENCSILDVGCGTGIVGKCLREAGFTGNIDGVDGSQGMIDEANKLENVYNKLYTEIIQPDGHTLLPKHKYDVVISGHSFFPNYLTCDHIQTLFDYLNIGGLLVFNMQKPCTTAEMENTMSIYYENVNKKLSEFVEEKRSKCLVVRDVVGEFPILKYFDSPNSNQAKPNVGKDVQLCFKKLSSQPLCN